MAKKKLESLRQKDAEKYFLGWYKERLPLWKKDPVLFSREVCGINPVGEQKELLMALAEGDKLAVKAGRAVGKSVIAGVAALWFITCHYDSLVLITSPNFDQVKDVIFGTVKSAWRKSPLLRMMFDATDTTFRHKVLRETWYIVLRTAAKGESIRGYNRPNKLYITDETTGITDDILDALLGSTDEANSKMLMISNPTKRSGKFYDIFTNVTAYPEWRRVTMSRLITGYKIIALSSISAANKAKRNWENKIRVFGNEHPDVRIEILGEFPLQDVNKAIPIELFDHVGNYNPFKDDSEVVTINLGLDIAGMGGDLIVYTTNKMNYDFDQTSERQFVHPMEYFEILDTYSRQNYNISRDRLINHAIQLVKHYAQIITPEGERGKFKMLYVNVDATGVGSAFIDAVREQLEKNNTIVAGFPLHKWVRVRGTQFQEAAEEKQHYVNRRSEMGEQFRHKLERNLEYVEQGKPPIIYIDMTNPTMFRGVTIEIGNIEKEYDSKSRIKFESKDKLRKRLKGASTDTADSLFLASYIKKPRVMWFI